MLSLIYKIYIDAYNIRYIFLKEYLLKDVEHQFILHQQ